MADDDEVIACSAAVLFCASAYLFKFNKRQHTVWVKRYLQKRPQYGVVNTLLPDLATSDDQPMDIVTFEELINYVIAS